MEKTFGDSAKKAADDLQGQLHRMQNSWTEFKQIMSKAVLPLTVSVTAVATDVLNGFNAGAKSAQGRGWGSVGQFFSGVAGAAGAEMDPKRIRENRRAELYRQEQRLQDKLRIDAEGGISATGNGKLGGLFWREARIDELSDVRAKLAKINKEFEADFAARIKEASKSLGDAQTPEMWAKWQKEQDQKKKAALAGAERDIRGRFADKSTGMSDAMREAERQQERLNGLLEVGSGVSKTYTADVTLLGKALASGKITTEEYSSAASNLWKTQTEAGKAWEASADAADKANKALNVWKADHESQLAAITEETTSVGQNAAARKVLLAGMQVEADARKKIEQLSLNLSGADRAAAVSAINAERDKQKALVETALIKQQAVDGAYQLEQKNRRFAADSILDERARSQAILDIESETWRQRIELAEVGSEERRRLEDAFQQWYSNQLSRPAIESMRKTLESIDRTFHDSFTRMLENGKADWDAFGKALATSFKSAVADEIYKMTIRPIVVSVVSSFAGGAGQAAGTAAGQSGSGIGGVVSGVQAAYGAVNGGITNAATAFATSGVGQYLGLSSTAPIATNTSLGSIQLAGTASDAAGGAYLTNSGSAAVGAAGWVAAILAAIYTGFEWQKRGWFNDNSTKGYLEEQEDVFTKLYSKHDRLFGHNRFVSTDAGGIQGVFDTSGFTGDRWQQFSQRGGTFRSDKRWTDTFELDSDIDSYLDGLMRQTVSQLQAIGKTLDVETVRAVEGFSHQFSLQLSENGSWEKAGEKIAGEMAKVSDELVKSLVPGLADLSLFGETATQTFTRLGQEVAATDAILLAMGKNAAAAFGGVGLASIAAREHLIDLAGGLESLASKTQSFYANFYTGEEQMALAAKQAQKVLDKGFAELGQGIPATREAFRALVESQDLSTDAGRRLWSSLLDLQDEFDTVADGADATAASMQAAADKLAAATTTAQQGQASLFDAFASDAQKLDAARKIVSDTFASIGKAVPDSAGAFLSLAQSIDPATEAGQSLIAALNKISGAFAYVQTTAAAAAKATLTGQASTLTGQASKIEYDMQSLVERFGSLSPAARTVADDLAATQQQLASLSDGLANLFNTAQLTDLQRLGQTVGYRDQIRGAISQINDDVFEAMLKGMARPQQIEQLKKAEADLWAGMSAAADKGQQAAKIRSVVLRRLGLESDEANFAASKVADLAKQARQDQIDTLRTQIDGMQRMRDLAGQIADFTDNLSIGDLSPLSYADQLASAKSLFEQTLAAAQIGDTQAQGQLTGNARTYLDEARRYFASSTDYAAIYEKVTGSLRGFAAPSDSALTAAQAQLDTLSKLPDVMAAVVDNSKNDVAALQAVQLALRNGDDYLSKSIDAQTVALQRQIDALTTIASNQEAQIRQAGTAYQQMTDELKAVKAQLAAIEANGALAGAA
jgi:hypothetical protein